MIDKPMIACSLGAAFGKLKDVSMVSINCSRALFIGLAG